MKGEKHNGDRIGGCQHRLSAAGKIDVAICIEDAPFCGIIRAMAPRFSEMNKVRVNSEKFGNYEGYVIASQFRDGRWIYKISISEDPTSEDAADTFDNWLPEECLELTK